MAKKEEFNDDEEEEDFEEDSEEEEEPWDDDKAYKENKKTSPVKQETKPKLVKQITERGSTYSVYHMPERTGIKNDKTGQPVAEDMWSAMAIIMTTLQELKDALK